MKLLGAMLKKVLAVGAVLFITASADAAEFGYTPVGSNVRSSDKADDHLSPVVQLVEGGRAFCTAFYVGHGRFVTAGHCAAEAKSPMHIQMQDGTFKSLDVEIIAVSDPDKGMPDFAVLEGDEDAPALKGRQPVDLDCGHKSKVGEDIRVEGFPAGMGFITTWGKVSGATEKLAQWEKPVTRINIAVAGGDSGGPTFLEKSNAVFAILVGGLQSNPNLSLVQPIAPVCSLLGLK